MADCPNLAVQGELCGLCVEVVIEATHRELMSRPVADGAPIVRRRAAFLLAPTAAEARALVEACGGGW